LEVEEDDEFEWIRVWSLCCSPSNHDITENIKEGEGDDDIKWITM